MHIYSNDLQFLACQITKSALLTIENAGLASDDDPREPLLSADSRIHSSHWGAYFCLDQALAER
jgi:hypothetical protein